MYYTVKENDKLDVKVGLEDQDKTFVFKDVDPADTKKVDASLKEDKVNLDVTKKDGSTVTLTPSEDSAKTEDEKKDEQEVKQEEKKEETAKADSSNKSNTSESKKNNTASTSNSSSNKNNSSSSSSKPSSKPSNSSSNNSSTSKPSNNSSNNSGSSKPSNNSGSNSNSSKPAEHTHNWVAQYKTVNVPEQGHNEQVLVQAAYDEQVPITEMRAHDICNDCGADITGNTCEHVEDHMINDTGNGGYHTEWRETVVGYKTVHHDAVYETRYVVDSPATTKQELTGYKCSGCGKTKAN